MRILQLAPLFAPLTDKLTYGSIERVVRLLDTNYVYMGHESVVSALEGSEVTGRLLPVSAQADLRGYEYQAEAAITFTQENDCEVIHIHRRSFLLSEAYRNSELRIPILVTLHGPLSNVLTKYNQIPYDPRVFYNAVSLSQARQLSRNFTLAGVVHNGVELDRFPYVGAKSDFILSLGRITQVKGQATAIKLALHLGIRLVLAGVVLPGDEAYFENGVLPHLASGSVDFVGPVDDANKVGLLASARAVIMPAHWEDPCPLVAIEAHACGTPVIGYRRGGLPEIVLHGRTGYLGESFDDLIVGCGRLHEFAPEACREQAERCFSAQLCAEKYIRLYRRINTRFEEL